MNRQQSHTLVVFARRLLTVSVALLGVSARPCSSTMPPELRNTIDALVAVLRSGDAAAYERFALEHCTPEFMARRRPEDRAHGIAQFHSVFGAFRVTSELVDSWTADLELRPQHGELRASLHLVLEATTPHRIQDLTIAVERERAGQPPKTTLPGATVTVTGEQTVPIPQVSNTQYAMKLDLSAFTLGAVKAEVVEHRGRRAIHLADVQTSQTTILDSMAVLNDSDFQDGTIELQIAGTPRPGESPDARGFVGIAFRVNADVSRYEYIYLRPTNGRADDQVRRNHSTQYASEPGYPWPEMRKENPNLYESYVDLEPDVWTKFRLVVSGRRAELYINDQGQPCLIVKDLKQGVTRGRIALWVGLAADGYFSDLRVTPAAHVSK
jgi:hypothetical protein